MNKWPDRCVNTEPGLRSHLTRKRDPDVQVTTLAESQVTAFNMISIELVEADEHRLGLSSAGRQCPVSSTGSFPDAAASIARACASASTELARIKARRPLRPRPA
jgi:hypothetical protein